MTAVRAILAVVSALLGIVLSIPVIVIGIPFWTVAFLTRWCSEHFGNRADTWEGIIEYNEHIGWKPKPNLDAYCSFPAGTFRVKTDSQGWRGEEDLARCQMLVLGDSFAFGYGVDHDKAYFSLIDSGLCVKAVGSPGYNMVQEILWLERFASQLRGKLVVWFICLGNDLYDNLLPNHNLYRTPFVSQVNGTGRWEVVTSHLRSEQWPCHTNHDSRKKEKWAATFTSNFLGQRAYSACGFLIQRAKETCARADAHLVVMTIPWMNQLSTGQWQESLATVGDLKSFDPDLPDREIGRICSKLKIPFVAGKSHLAMGDHIPGDGHWNERGQQRMAQLLQALYQEHALGGRPCSRL
jgi:hypothetical protein